MALRRRAAESIVNAIPERVARWFFATQKSTSAGGERAERDTWLKDVDDVLNVFSDTYANKHLVFGIIELVIVRLVPEMAEKGVEELLKERINIDDNEET